MVLPTLTPAGYVFPPTSTSQTLNPNFGRINATLWQADSYYDALQADITKRVSRGFEFHAAYTWGKSIDTLSATEADDAFPNGLFNQLFFDPRLSRGLSDFNVAQDFVLELHVGASRTVGRFGVAALGLERMAVGRSLQGQHRAAFYANSRRRSCWNEGG